MSELIGDRNVIDGEIPNGEATFADFPVGTPVKIIAKCVDFNFFWGETGIVKRNSGDYLGIIVQFHEPRRFKSGEIQWEFNFNPQHLRKARP